MFFDEPSRADDPEAQGPFPALLSEEPEVSGPSREGPAGAENEENNEGDVTERPYPSSRPRSPDPALDRRPPTGAE